MSIETITRRRIFGFLVAVSTVLGRRIAADEACGCRGYER